MRAATFSFMKFQILYRLVMAVFVTGCALAPCLAAATDSTTSQLYALTLKPVHPPGWAGNTISISCNALDGGQPTAGYIFGSATVQITHYQDWPDGRGSSFIFDRESQINGTFTVVTSYGTETVLVTGGLSELKIGASGMPMHLVGVSTRGRILEIRGNEYYSEFESVSWAGIELSHHCSVTYQ